MICGDFIGPSYDPAPLSYLRWLGGEPIVLCPLPSDQYGNLNMVGNGAGSFKDWLKPCSKWGGPSVRGAVVPKPI